MSTLKIENLVEVEELDREALLKICGGFFWSVMMYQMYGGSYEQGGGGGGGHPVWS